MRILVCGGRQFANPDVQGKPPAEVFEETCSLVSALDALHEAEGSRITCIIHGCAPGADTAAANWAGDRGIAVEPYPAEWRKYGSAAGPMRNARMLALGSPDVVIAFPGNRGTANMVRLAKKAGVRVIEVSSTR
jgi:hypothetical protein